MSYGTDDLAHRLGRMEQPGDAEIARRFAKPLPPLTPESLAYAMTARPLKVQLKLVDAVESSHLLAVYDFTVDGIHYYTVTHDSADRARYVILLDEVESLDVIDPPPDSVVYLTAQASTLSLFAKPVCQADAKVARPDPADFGPMIERLNGV